MTTLRERLVKIGARIVRHGRFITFQMAKVMVPRGLFKKFFALIAKSVATWGVGLGGEGAWTWPWRRLRIRSTELGLVEALGAASIPEAWIMSVAGLGPFQQTLQ